LNTCIVSAFDVDSKRLYDFYDIVYPDRKDTLLRIWKWLYRTDSYKYKTPFVILDNGRVIAHASLIPFTIKRGNKYYTAVWFVDIEVLSDFFTLRTIMSSLVVWGKERDYNFIRFYTSGKDLSSYLKKSLKPFVKYPIFAYYSKDELLLEKLKRSKWNWGLIDSDFEKF
jgi:hypothetical protein